jgi:hypothetical protein
MLPICLSSYSKNIETWNIIALDSELIPKYTFHTTVVLLPDQ